MTIQERLTAEFNIKPWQTENVIGLIGEGNTIPFISRYRKEATGELNDEVLRSFDDRLKYLRALEERKEDIKRLIDEQGLLTEELTEAIEKAEMLTELEDIYRPYRPKRRTRATIAKEKGLEPLAQFIKENYDEAKIEAEAEKYIDEEKEIMSTEDALAGAMDIIAEEISDNADYRKAIRRLTFKHGILKSKATTEEDSVYAQYYDYSEPVGRIAPHRVLAIDRGENEKFLSVGIELDTDIIFDFLNKKEEKRNNGVVNKWNIMSTEDAYKRLIAPSIEREIRNDLTENAQEKAMVVFKVNLKNLLMQPPIKGMRVIGLDPGYRTGCKVGVIDEYGKVLDTGVIYVTHSQAQKDSAKEFIKNLIKKYDIKLISIGNGTASGETEVFVSETIKEIPEAGTKYIITNEAGASVYSASKLGTEEFPDFDVTQRSAVSIARRVQDPLAELVKIEPKAIGVGQYQHDMNQKRLGETLGGVVEDCVNSVGVDLNTASWPLLSYISGINGTVAKNIVAYREENGKFNSRAELKNVAKLGPKAFEQCAGFLRIHDGKNPLDNTSVHPESYKTAEALLKSLGYSEKDVAKGGIADISSKIKDVDALAKELGVGVPTLKDIVEEIAKPGRDPRDDIETPQLRADVMSIEDLSEGMILTGTVRNVIDFGVFVDIGVHQDGLVHISEISDKFIKHPMDILSVGDIVKVKILNIDLKKKRISLTMKNI